MSTNPYASPPPDSTPPPHPFGLRTPELREELRAVATYQRYVLYCLLIQILAYLGGGYAMQSGLLPPLLFQVVLGLLGLAGVVCAILLATRVYGVVLGVIFGLFVIFPCLGFLLLVLINQRATAFLQQHGVVVGFMGADPDSI